MTKPVDDFQSAHSPFEMSLEEMTTFWERRALAINVPSHSNRIPREPQAFTTNVRFLNEEVLKERSVSLSVESVHDADSSAKTIMMLHIMESTDGANYDLLLNLDPSMKVAKNEDFEDGTLRCIKTFPKTWVGVRAMFKECEEKVLHALEEGDNYPFREAERMKNKPSDSNRPAGYN